MRQREIYYAALDPVRGNEQIGNRPVVVISGNVMNSSLGICIICPLTTTIKNLTSRVLLKKDNINNLRADSDILIFHVRTIAKERLSRMVGEITNAQLEQVIGGLNDMLRY